MYLQEVSDVMMDVVMTIGEMIDDMTMGAGGAEMMEGVD